MVKADRSFTVVDYVIFGFMLVVSVGIGVFHGCFGKRQRSARELLVANRQMTVFPTAMSLLASFMSGLTILGNPSEIYYYGSMFCWIGAGYSLVTIATANIFIPLFHKLELTSTYEYLGLRFNRYVKLLGSCLFMTQITVYMALVLYAPALALNQVTGLNTWVSVISIGVVVTFYTTIGGMKAVMWTDAFQITMMVLGLLVSLIKGVSDLGGMRRVIESNWKYERIEFFVLDLDPTVRHTVWGLMFGNFIQWLSIYGVNQSQVQRYLSVPTVRIAKRAIYYNLAGLWFLLILTLFVGMTIFTKYQDCDPLSNKDIQAGEQLYPLYVMDTLRSTTGLPGLFMSCLFSAALSTLSSGLNGLSAVALDLLKEFHYKDLDDHKAGSISKFLCVGFGLLCLILTYLASFLGTLLQAAHSLFGVIGGPLLGLFILGLFIPFSNSKGAIVGTLSGLAFLLWIFFGFNIYGIKYPKKPIFTHGCNDSTLIHNLTTPLITTTLATEKSGLMKFHSISYTWYGLMAVSVVCLVGSIVSLLTGPTKPSQVNSDYIIPLFDRLFPCLPQSIKNKLHCGFTYKEKIKFKPLKVIVSDDREVINENKSDENRTNANE